MALCKRDGSDPLLRELVAKGINLLVPPRDGIEPGGLVLGSRGNAARVGSWPIALGVDVSPIVKPEPGFKAVRFVVSSKLAAKAGATLLGKLLAGWNLPEGSFSGAMASSGATSLSLDLVAPAVCVLANFDEVLEQLRSGEAAPRASYDDNRFFIVERIWRAKGLRLELFDKSDNSVSVSAEARELLSATTGLSFADEGKGKFSFKADQPLIFGVSLRELDFTGGLVREWPTDKHMQFRDGSVSPNYRFASDEDAFLDLQD